MYPFLKIGIKVATFQSIGSLPSLKDFLKIIDRGILNSCAASFKTLGGSPSGLVALPE